MSTSIEELRQRIRERLAGVSRAALTETELVTALNGTEAINRKATNECGRCGAKFSKKSRHLVSIYHQRKGQKWQVIGQERLYLCAGCMTSVMGFIDGDF